MMQQIDWAKSDRGEPDSPFMGGAVKRKLKLTFHSESLESAAGEDLVAIVALRGLAQIDEVVAADTAKGEIPHLIIGDFSPDHVFTDVGLIGKDCEIRTGIQFPRQWLEMSKKLTGKSDYNDPEVRNMLSLILMARAHHQIDHDLLITLSPELLRNRFLLFIKDTNPCTPCEAIKILGLYLRYRKNYIFDVSNGVKYFLDKGFFYWLLTRHRLPRMWKYFSACVYSGQQRKDGISDLGGSILTRSVRALEARDEIGYQFYSTQSNNTRDAMMYHFDYLTLLLSGIFDSMASVARRVYSIRKPNERNSNFRSEKYLNALRKNGGDRLYEVVTHQDFIDLMTMLTALRNTIHGANLRTLAYKEPVKEEKSFVALEKTIANAVWDASARYSSPNEWGIFQSHEILFEPYTYSITLIRECYKFINSIANATDVVKLFPAGSTPRMLVSPPSDSLFNKFTRKRVHILG